MLVVVTAVAGGWLLEPRLPLYLCLFGVTFAGLRRLTRGARRRKRAQHRAAEVLELCDALSAELRSGLPAPVALARACGPWPQLTPVVAASQVGGDVSAVLGALSASEGASGLRALAAAWRVAGQSGASLAVVLDRVAEGLRSEDAARREVNAALGPPRATGRMLAVLPVFGVGLAISMGADPLHFLFGTLPGLGCLVAGVSLALAGLLWVDWLASVVER